VATTPKAMDENIQHNEIYMTTNKEEDHHE
jgi:hypothetical protein